MKFALYTTSLSAHQLPVYRLVRAQLGAANCRYICEMRDGYSVQSKLGNADVEWIESSNPEAADWLEDSDVLYVGGVRPLDLMERRAARGLKTLFQSERWFKPLVLFDLRLFDCLISVVLPGWVRMWVPGYRRMAKRFVRWANGESNAKVLAIGPWAKKDFLRMGVKLEKIVDWGYFVEKGIGRNVQGVAGVGIKVLWVGRDLAWKRVRDIERAVGLANRMMGTDENGENRKISFTKLTGVTMEEVRRAMREHDVYVLASDANEGWGAALNEALEEGMNALGTFDAGASAAMLPRERLYHAGDNKALARLLTIEYEDRGRGQKMLPPCSIGDWTAARAAERLLKLLR